MLSVHSAWYQRTLHERLQKKEESVSSQKNLSFSFCDAMNVEARNFDFYWASSILSGAVWVSVWYDCLHTNINILLLSLSKINKSFRLQHHCVGRKTKLSIKLIYLFKRWNWSVEREATTRSHLPNDMLLHLCALQTNSSGKPTIRDFSYQSCGFPKQVFFSERVSLAIEAEH